MNHLKPRFDGTIQLGHIMQMLILSAGIVGFWMKLDAQIEQHTKDLIRHEQEINALHRTDDALRENVVKLSDNLTHLSAIIDERTHRGP